MPPKTKKSKTIPLSLDDMPCEILERIVSFLDPPSVFSMVTSSKALLRPYGSWLLKACMKRRLDDVFAAITADRLEGPSECYRRPFTVQDVFPDEERNLDFDASGRPQVILSGSAVVQCVLDKTWDNSDLDIFCTWEAAPMVRRRLFDRCGLICSGVDNDYMQLDRDLVGDLEGIARSVIHHVESYSSRPSRPTRDEEYPSYRDWSYEEGNRYKRKEFSDEEYVKLTKEWGADTLDNSRPWGGPVGIPGGVLDGDFMYNYNLREVKFVQLIIGTQQVKDARRLRNTFDLEICKCGFNGRGFIIPAPADTFAGRTIITPARHEIMKQFVQSFVKVLNARAPKENEYNLRDILKAMSKKSWKGVGLGPYEDDDDWEDFSRRYIFCQRLFQRLWKYHRRGIEIINPPNNALSVAEEFPYLEVMR